MMKSNKKLNEFLDVCISTGSYVDTGLKLSEKEILEIEDILNRYNDTTARTKIRKIIKNH